MTKLEFKTRWESNDSGGGITYDDIAECARQWGIASAPRISPMEEIRYKVLKAADVIDANLYWPFELEPEHERNNQQKT